MIDQTRNAGFQEEKYQDYYLDLRWARPDLVGLIDRRVIELYRLRRKALIPTAG